MRRDVQRAAGYPAPIRDVLLHAAVCCGLPAVNAAFRIAAGVLAPTPLAAEEK